ncbi:serine/threonine-protein kinase [Kutzneria sp. NPDC052558]|uniref:serine/threonine-protein kinase n=1 Tax=Kutzneria sp. NPDC052558 TaxID=3364121 RepID=UPI0037CBDE37
MEEELGRGGMGVVWRAVDLELGRQVTLKRSLGDDVGQIRREARIGAGLLHSNVVTVFDTVVDSDAQWLVTEYLAARSLEELIDNDGPLPEDRVRKIGAQLAGALAAMHSRGIVHRDIKPGNVLVTADDVAKLTDMGIARWTEVTRTGGAQLTGTLGYVAPEVADGGEAGPASDVFSLGATLYAAIEGRSPWGTGEDGPFAQMRRAAAGKPLPAERAGKFEPVLTALMARHPADRPTAADVVTMLTVDDPEIRRPRRLRRRLLIGVAAAVVVVLAAGFLVTRLVSASLTGNYTLGSDPAAIDPCKVIDTKALVPYGEPFVDPEELDFGSCVVTTTLADKTGQVQTVLDLTGPERYPSRPPVPGQMGDIERPDPHDGTCQRAISLADTNRIVVTSHPLDDAKNTPLCTISEAVITDAVLMLANGPLPRRTQPFASWSLANVEACGLLSTTEITGALGENKAPDHELGGWGCTWEHDPRTITLRYSREWPIENDFEDFPGERIKVGAKAAVITTVPGGHPECRVQIISHFYAPYGVLKGTDPNREEIATVTMEDTSAVNGDALCGTARSLATAIAGRLPS